MRTAAAFFMACTVANASPPTTGGVVGIVTDDTGRGVHATIRFAIEGSDPIYVESDTDGKYRSDALTPGGWNVSVSESDHVTGERYLDIVAGRDVAGDVTLRSHPRNVIEGVVVGANGPVDGARVEAVDLSDTHEVAATVTTADGHYTLAVGSIDVNNIGMNGATVVVRHAGFAPVEHDVTFGRSGYTKQQDFTLVAGGSIAGTVREARTRAPVPYAAIVVERDTGMKVDSAGTGRSRTITADASGHFKLDDLIPSTYELGGHADHRASSAPVLVTVGKAEQVDGVEVLVAKR